MSNKETNRTMKKLWLLNYCSIIVILTLHLSLTLATETKAVETSQNETLISADNSSSPEHPIAEALTRLRRQPPRAIIKHIIRPKRYKMKRMKRPKIKYSFAEPPPSYYYSRKPTVISMKKPTFDTSIFEEFSHMNVESANFDLPPSSYESQTMDLDLYKHYKPALEASYKEVQKPTYTYKEPEVSYKEEPSYTKAPRYTYSAPELSYKEPSKPSYSYSAPEKKPTVTYSYVPAQDRKPHTKYGVPDFIYSTGYDKPGYEPPKPAYTEPEKPIYSDYGKNEYTYSSKPAKEEPPRIPATNYGVPDVHIPASGNSDYNKYTVVEEKPSYETYAPARPDSNNYHFAEPPQAEPTVEITYSPSYEINIPASHGNSYGGGEGGKYNEEHHNPPPPQHPSPPEYSPPPQHALPPSYEEANFQERPKYEEPPQQYQPPSNSYEGPPQDNYEHSAPGYQEGSDTNQPASYQPAPPRHESPTDYIPASQDLPINVNHKQPAYDYPKSSYEVPIYDPIPFDASSNQEREVYPPQTYEETNRQQPPNIQSDYEPQPNNLPEQGPESHEVSPNDIHSSGTQPQNTLQTLSQSPINRLRRTRKRKRTRGSSTTVSTTKHILDVPELEEAFEKENRNKRKKNQEPDAHPSLRVENVDNQNNNYYGPWNPMKIRTSPIMNTSPSTTLSLNTLSTKAKRFHYKSPRTTALSTTTTTEAPSKVEIISIEKSRSKTYYDGISSPSPKIYSSNFFRNRHRAESSTATVQPQVKSTQDNKVSKRTTKTVFDTTIFKSPVNDRDVYRNLPKNHKLF